MAAAKCCNVHLKRPELDKNILKSVSVDEYFYVYLLCVGSKVLDNA